MKKKVFMLALCLNFLILCCAWAADTHIVYTEEFPPFQYMEEERLTGVSAQIVSSVFNRAKISHKMKSYPWVRSYNNVLENPGTFIFSISRLPAREKLFKWVGVIVPSQYSVFSLKSRTDIRIEKLEDAKKYRIGTTVNDARELYLISKGFELKEFDRVASINPNYNNYLKLKKHRIDLWPMPDAVAYYIVRKTGDDPEKILKNNFYLKEISTGGYYLAANSNTDSRIIKKLKQTLSEYKNTEDYKMILKKWGFDEI